MSASQSLSGSPFSPHFCAAGLTAPPGVSYGVDLYWLPLGTGGRFKAGNAS